jgi:leader peptidase (prepilin peptidase)/N-methyltransferase
MTLLLQVGAVGLGVIIGSFLNALSFRFNTGRSVMNGRSRCMHCGHELGVLDLIPVFSYIFLGGRCRYCGAHISLQYPIVEVAGGALSFLIYTAHPTPLSFAFWFIVWMTLLFIVVYDLRHTVIPWSAPFCSWHSLFFRLFLSINTPQTFLFVPDFWSLAAGPLLAAPLVFLSAISRGTWMGWGDGPLELSLGWLLGLSVGGTALMLSFWIGATVGILLIAAKKGLTMKSELPFAPFLVLGALVAHFFHVDFFQMFPFLWQ